MASVAETSSIPPELAIGSRPLLVRFNDGEQKPGAMVMDPFDVELREARTELDMLRGKECRACLEGEWLLMSDEGTGECFLLSLASLCKIPLPPLPADDAQSLSQCALSSPTPADCTVVFSTNFDNYLLCCRPGDEGWRKLPVETDGTYRLAMGSIVSSRGRMYADTEMGTFIAVDASMPSSSGVAIERTGIPRPSTMRWPCKPSLVESDGDIFLLQFYIHGFSHSSEVVDMDIHLLDTSAYVWNKVESIGDRTIFVAGDSCVVLPSASRAGIQPGYIHVLHKLCRDGVRLYTIRLHDRTMSCTLLPGSYDNMCWVVPSSFIKKKNEESAFTLFSSESNIKINKPAFDEDVEQVAAPWSSLPVDMVDELVSRLSFIDYLSVRQVCKRWSSISKPAQYAKRYPTYPVLMSICSSSAGTFKLFDPITEKEYTLKNSSLVSCDDYFQMLLFAKHGWVLVLRGSRYLYATNPFTGEMLELPEIPWLRNQFDGISFSSAPKSPDCVVCAIDKTRNAAHNNLVMVWHAGDEHWTQLEIDDNTQFCSSYSNPVFYHDEFYCLGTRGNLGVFNPHNMTWRVLDKPGAILDGDPKPGDQYCHLLEFRDNLIAIFRPHEDGPMDLYRLDMSQMVWTKVERLDNEVVFVDNWNAVMVPAPRDTCCNRIYVSKLGGYNEEKESNSSAFYDLKSRKYYPSYFNLTERMNSIWIEPNFKSQ